MRICTLDLFAQIFIGGIVEMCSDAIMVHHQLQQILEAVRLIMLMCFENWVTYKVLLRSIQYNTSTDKTFSFLFISSQNQYGLLTEHTFSLLTLPLWYSI
jgi:hypothetical protein